MRQARQCASTPDQFRSLRDRVQGRRWLPEAEIAPTMGSRTTVDRAITVVDGVNTTPVTLYVHVDHLHRPVRMTNAAKATQWDVIWTPWGAPHTITGAQTLNARFPGQWFQLEAGLHYNWHRHYDPSLGRYTQPDPLGFVDGPSVYAYAGSNPGKLVDPKGLDTDIFTDPIIIGAAAMVVIGGQYVYNQCRKYIKRWTEAPPPPENDNCPKGMCCFTHEAADQWGRICNYKCTDPDEYGNVFQIERAASKQLPCRSMIIDIWNSGNLGQK